jgi:hypothetical protein
MKELSRSCAVRVLAAIVVVVSMFSFIAGCKKDSGPTGPFEPPSLPTVAGHWIGSGSYFDQGVATRLNYSWVADFNATQNDNTFTGTMTSTMTDPNIYYTGDQYISRVKGTFTLSRQLTIRDTSAVYIHRGVSTPITDPRVFSTYEACVLSSGGDTITYGGPSPAFETFVMIKQK